MNRNFISILVLFICLYTTTANAQFAAAYKSTVLGNWVKGQAVIKYGKNYLEITSEGNGIALLEVSSANGDILRKRSIAWSVSENIYPEVLTAIVDNEHKIALGGFYEGTKSLKVFYLRYDFETDTLLWAKKLQVTDSTNMYADRWVNTILEDTVNHVYQISNNTGLLFSVDIETGNTTSMHITNPRSDYAIYGSKKHNDNFFIYGSWIDPVHHYRYAYAARLNKWLKPIFSNTYLADTTQSSAYYGAVSQMLVTSNALYLGCSESNDNVYGGQNVYIIKCSTNGAIQWTKKYAITFGDEQRLIYGMESLPNGDILVAGSAGSNDAFMMRVDTSGNIKWSYTYHFTVDAVAFYRMVLSRNQFLLVSGNYALITGEVQPSFFPEAFLIKVDIRTGVVNDCQSPLNIAVTGSANITTNENLTVTKNTTRSGNFLPSTSVSSLRNVTVQICTGKNTEANNTITKINFTNDIHIYPNPVSSILNIDMDAMDEKEVFIFNAKGVLYKQLKTNNRNVSIDIEMWMQGLYFIKIKRGAGNIYTSNFYKK